MDSTPSVEELIKQTAARRERLLQFRKEIQGGSTSHGGTDEIDNRGTKENDAALSADSQSTSKDSVEQVPEHLKKTFACLADQYRSVDEEDSQNESICSGSLSGQRSSTSRPNDLSPRKSTARISSNPTTNKIGSPVSREKREHITCGDSPRLHAPKLMKSDVHVSTAFSFESTAQPEVVELTLKERKALFENASRGASESKSSPVRATDVNFRRNVFQEAAARSQDPAFPKKNEFRTKTQPSPKKTPESSNVECKRKLFSHPAIETPKEVGAFTKNLQDKLLLQTEAWKHNELSRKIDEQKQEDMAVLRKRWELMAEEEKNAAERGRMVEKVLQQQRAGGAHPPKVDRPPPLPIPGASSLQDRQTKLAALLPQPGKKNVVSNAAPPMPVKNADALVRIQNSAQEAFGSVPPPPPPPPMVKPSISVGSGTHQRVQVAASITKHVRMQLPEEEGTDISADEEEDIHVQYAYASTDGEDVEMEYQEYEEHYDTRKHHGEVSSEDSSTEELPVRSGILKRKDTDILYVREHIEDNHSVSSAETESSVAPMSLSFYRRSQKESAPKNTASSVVSMERRSMPPVESEEDKRDRLILLYQAKIDNFYALSSQQHTILIQTTAALNLCKSSPEFQGSIERAECERVLLCAAKRRDAFHMEINRLKTLIAQLKQGTAIPDQSCHGKVEISNIIVPTKEGFADYVKTETDMMHYFVVLGRSRDEVHVSEMLNSVQHLEVDGTFHFSTSMEFEDLENDFIISLEVYAVQARRETVSHEEKYHIRDGGKKKEKGGFSLKKLLPHLREGSAGHVAPGTPSKQEIRASSFGCIGSCSLTLSNIHGSVFHLSKVPEHSAVEGIVRMKTTCGVSLESSEEGFLTIFEDVCGPTAWHRRYCQLKNDTICMWRYPEEQETHAPQVMSLRWIKGQADMLSSAQCARPHTFQMLLTKPLSMSGIDSREPGPHKYLFAADTKEERFIWCEKINRVLSQIRAWIPSEKERSASNLRR